MLKRNLKKLQRTHTLIFKIYLFCLFSIKDSTGTVYGNTTSNILTLNIYSDTPQLIMKGEISGSKQTLKVIDMLPPWAGPPGNPQP